MQRSAGAAATGRPAALPGRRRPGGGVGPRLQALMRDEQGAVSIEFTTLVPFFVMLLVFFADATVIYLTHTEMYNAARDIARRATTGELTTADEIQTYAENHLFLGQRNYYVGIDLSGDKTIAVVINLYEAAPFGYFFGPILGDQLVASATMEEEPRIE